MNLDRPAKVRRIRNLVEHDRISGAIDLVGEEDAAAFVLAVAVIRSATHGRDWTSWDEASLLYDQFRDQIDTKDEEHPMDPNDDPETLAREARVGLQPHDGSA